MLVNRNSSIHYGGGRLLLAAFFLAVFVVFQIGIPTKAYASSALSKGHREALKRGCDIKVLRGEYKNMSECRREDLRKIVSKRELVTLNDLTKSQKKRFQLACLKAMTIGILAYDNCLYDVLVDLGLREARPKLTRALPPPKVAATPSKPVIPTKPVTRPNNKMAQELSTSSLVAQLERGTVMILTTKGSTGSGFFIAPGLILTNRHVVENSQSSAYVTSRAIGRIQLAKVVAISKKPGRPGQLDFALLSVDKNLVRNFSFPINLAPEKLKSVIAAGYPGLVVKYDESFSRLLKGDASAAPDLVLSRGEISANQESRDGVDTLVHTAQIMPGNSGGPLVDACGRVVGVNTFIRFDPDNPGSGKAGFALSSREVLDFLSSHNVTANVDNKACGN
jgi:S1-C subfamily serine protease